MGLTLRILRLDGVCGLVANLQVLAVEDEPVFTLTRSCSGLALHVSFPGAGEEPDWFPDVRRDAFLLRDKRRDRQHDHERACGHTPSSRPVDQRVIDEVALDDIPRESDSTDSFKPFG